MGELSWVFLSLHQEMLVLLSQSHLFPDKHFSPQARLCLCASKLCPLVLLPRKMPAEDKGAVQDRKSPPAEVKTVPNEATQTKENESKA